MKIFALTGFVFLALVSVLVSPSFAQIPARLERDGPEGEITVEPICGKLVNRSDQTIMGSISTAPQTLPNGESISHRENFKLAVGEEQEICAKGPFFEGRRLELVIRTIIPLFDCKTKIDRTIYLDATPRPGSFTQLTATCF